MLKILLFLALLNLVYGNSVYSEYSTAVERSLAKATLNYGDACDYEDQKRAFANEEYIHQKMSGITNVSELSEIARSIADFAKSVTALCDTSKILQCQEDTRTCGCFKELPGVSFNATAVEVNGQCRYVRGSTCLPTEVTLIEQCEDGSSCKIEADRQDCTMDNFAQALIAQRKLTVPDAVTAMRISYTELIGGMCKCL